jgi:hypothetical protein
LHGPEPSPSRLWLVQCQYRLRSRDSSLLLQSLLQFYRAATPDRNGMTHGIPPQSVDQQHCHTPSCRLHHLNQNYSCPRPSDQWHRKAGRTRPVVQLFQPDRRQKLIGSAWAERVHTDPAPCSAPTASVPIRRTYTTGSQEVSYSSLKVCYNALDQ